MPQALSGLPSRVAITAVPVIIYRHQHHLGWLSHRDRANRNSRHQRAAQHRRHGDADAFQRPANRQPNRAAESQVSGAREALRVLEQSVLLSAAIFNMDYLRDAAIVEDQRSNVRVLEQTLKQTRDRFNVGEVTRTDVAQSEAQLAAGKTQLLTAEANLVTTRSNFRRIIGNEPQQLAPGSPVDAICRERCPRGRTRSDGKSECDRRDVRHRCHYLQVR